MERLLLLILLICVISFIYAFAYVFMKNQIHLFFTGSHDNKWIIRLDGTKTRNTNVSPPSKSEARIIAIAERLTGKKFPCIRPNWLRDGGAPLELDGYCEELKVAIEFQGPLHTKWFSSREPYETYIARVERDEAKKTICARAGVALIVIDNEVLKLTPNSIEKYVYSRLADARVPMRMTREYIPAIDIIPFRM